MPKKKSTKNVSSKTLVLYQSTTEQLIVTKAHDKQFIKNMKADGYDLLDEDIWSRSEIYHGFVAVETIQGNKHACFIY